MKNDSSTTFSEIRQALAEIVAAKGWLQTHTSKNLSMAIAVEAAELMELFVWASPSQVENIEVDEDRRIQILGELADILVNVFALANHLDADISTVMRDKLNAHSHRFPDRE